MILGSASGSIGGDRNLTDRQKTNVAPVAVDLVALLDPAHTALVTQECQNGVIGDDAALRELADEARREAVPNIARLVDAAHEAGVAVLHCLAVRRADDRGSNQN